MKLCAIISEFNPFTNGHEYIIKKAKQETGLEILCLTSGNFVQRGEIACLDKYQRATCAINAGASYVFELPVCYALSSAQNFAQGAIKCLKGIKNVSHLAFGVETKNVELIKKIVKIKTSESKEFKNAIKQSIKNGNSYSSALYNAVLNELPNNQQEIKEIFNGANNILAIEYLCAIEKYRANITPVFVQRKDNGYNSLKVFKDKETKKCFASATKVRELINENKIKKLKSLVPLYCYENIKNTNIKDAKERLASLIYSSIQNKSIKELESYQDYNQSLAGLIHNKSKEILELDKLIEELTCKSFRKNRIKKLLLYPLLSLDKKTYEDCDKNLSINCLIAKNEKKSTLSQIKKNSSVPIIISNKDQEENKNNPCLILSQNANDVYNIVCKNAWSKDKTMFIK